MFVVAPVARKVDPENPGQYGRHFPVVFEDDEQPNSTGPIAHRDTREDAQKLADALNKAMKT